MYFYDKTVIENKGKRLTKSQVFKLNQYIIIRMILKIRNNKRDII